MKRLWMLAYLFAWQGGLAVEPDVDGTCLDCHRAHPGRDEVPAIEGQHAAYLEHQLQRFRERHRDSFPMSVFAAGMDDATIRAYAAALAERVWNGMATARTAADAIDRGRVAAERRDCAGCHGAAFMGEGDIPRLAGQQAGYLARQIEGFGKTGRFHPPTGTGAPMRTVPPGEARDLAAFLQALGGSDAGERGQ